MRRTDLKSIEGLSRKQIESIMNLHQLDIVIWKKKITAKDEIINNLKENIQCLKAVLNEFKDVDVHGLKQEVSYWKEKYNIDINKLKYENAVSLMISKYKDTDYEIIKEILGNDIKDLFCK